MNQELNNLNQNNFNTQCNNGIPNNQPLNNQSMSFQQPIQQPMNNTFNNDNTNNLNFNNKPPKKINLGLIIGIIVTVIIIGAGVIFGSKFLSNTNKNNDVNNNVIEENKNTTNNKNNSKEKYFFKINDDKISFPCKVSDFQDIGFELSLSQQDEESLKDASKKHYLIHINLDRVYHHQLKLIVKPENTNVENLEVIGISMYGWEYSEIDFQFNDLTLYKSSIDDILDKFGNPEIPEKIDRSQYVIALSYNEGKLVFGTMDNIFTHVQYIATEE